jgi:hypothetical protein
MQINLLAG